MAGLTRLFCVLDNRVPSSSSLDSFRPVLIADWIDGAFGVEAHPIETGSTLAVGPTHPIETGSTLAVGPTCGRCLSAVVDPVQVRPLSCDDLGYQIGSQGDRSELERSTRERSCDRELAAGRSSGEEESQNKGPCPTGYRWMASAEGLVAQLDALLATTVAQEAFDKLGR